jgi:hypothetical protein
MLSPLRNRHRKSCVEIRVTACNPAPHIQPRLTRHLWFGAASLEFPCVPGRVRNLWPERTKAHCAFSKRLRLQSRSPWRWRWWRYPGQKRPVRTRRVRDDNPGERNHHPMWVPAKAFVRSAVGRRESGRNFASLVEVDRVAGWTTTVLLPNPLPMFTYARGGGVSRVAKGADCKSDHFGFCINKHSEKIAKSLSNHINRLAAISEWRRRRIAANLFEDLKSALVFASSVAIGALAVASLLEWRGSQGAYSS